VKFPVSLLLCATFAASPRLLAQHLAPEPGSELDRGRQLFEHHCAACHGPHGEGGRGPTLAQPTLPRASDDDSLLRIIRSGISGTEMPAARIARSEIPYVAAYVRFLGRLPREEVPGDAAHGAQLFATKGQCTQCHTLNGHGGAVGPDLSEIGRKRSAAYLRRALLDPGADVPQSYNAFRSDVSLPENYVFVRAVPRQGEPVAGIRVNEDTFSIQVRDVAGRVHSFFKSDLLELKKDWKLSPMPSYAGALSPDELNDVVAFLVSLRGGRNSNQYAPP
jgi:putative heme-binding domain-containing protein